MSWPERTKAVVLAPYSATEADLAADTQCRDNDRQSKAENVRQLGEQAYRCCGTLVFRRFVLRLLGQAPDRIDLEKRGCDVLK